MTNLKLAAALASLLVTGALANAAAASPQDALPSAAYFLVDLHYCAPPAVALVKNTPAPSGDAAIVYETVLVGMYAGNCDDFHAKEIRPRLFLSHEGS